MKGVRRRVGEEHSASRGDRRTRPCGATSRGASTMLSTVDLFQDFPLAALAHLAAHSQQHTFRAGELLLRQGEASAHMYVIVRGRVCKVR
jgi:hypothetical protein